LKKSFLPLGLISSLLCLELVVSCSPLVKSDPIKAQGEEASWPISVDLTLSKAPRLNEPAVLKLTMASAVDAPGTQATITLPEGSSLLSGSLNWSGDLRAHQAKVLQVTFMFTSEGNKILTGKALRPAENGDIWGDAAYIYLHSTRFFGLRGFAPDLKRDAEGQSDQP
jgi:hypothetical protein